MRTLVITAVFVLINGIGFAVYRGVTSAGTPSAPPATSEPSIARDDVANQPKPELAAKASAAAVPTSPAVEPPSTTPSTVDAARTSAEIQPAETPPRATAGE